ncbi:MAG TPA: HNH endonuclease [Pseudomonas sp.]|nr:HNH endonuclease [Pseudomonas sp.]
MLKVTYTGNIKEFVDAYDKVDHEIWNNTAGLMLAIRKHIRDHYLLQQGYRCAYCKIEKKEANGLTWDVEHILPKSKYPQYLFHPENLAIACKECNIPKDDHDILVGQKSASYPRGIGRYKIIHPHFDNYDEHLEIAVVDGRRIYRVLNDGKGMATYALCNLARFDHKYAGWSSFDEAIVAEVSRFLDNCPPDSTPAEIQRMLGHLRFVERH